MASLRRIEIPLGPLRRVPEWWNREFSDARLILERDGDLQYFHLTGRLQRIFTRAAMVCSSAVVLTFVLLVANTVRVVLRAAHLEAAQTQTFATLAELDASVRPSVTDPASVKTMAQRIRQRQATLTRLLETSVSALRSENAELWGGLQTSGIGEQRVDTIKGRLPAGGPPIPPSSDAFEADSREVIEQVMRNKELKEVLRTLPARMPLADAAVTSDYGPRRHPVLGGSDEHRGLDMYSSSGRDQVRAVAAGTVSIAGYNGSYGNMVLVDHPGGIQTLYGHMAKVAVRPGQSVLPGAELGLVGNTGLSTGKHLHFEVRVGGVPLDPEKVISAARNLQ